MRNKDFMGLAIVEARRGIKKGHGGPFGAVIVKDGKVVASGHNCVLKNNDSTCHGEINAIRKAEKKLRTHDLSGCEIYTTGEPCPMCLAAILWTNIGKIYYGCTLEDNSEIGFRDKKIEKNIFDRVNLKNKKLLEEKDRDYCLELFEEYKNIKNKIIY